MKQEHDDFMSSATGALANLSKATPTQYFASWLDNRERVFARKGVIGEPLGTFIPSLLGAYDNTRSAISRDFSASYSTRAADVLDKLKQQCGDFDQNQPTFPNIHPIPRTYLVFIAALCNPDSTMFALTLASEMAHMHTVLSSKDHLDRKASIRPLCAEDGMCSVVTHMSIVVTLYDAECWNVQPIAMTAYLLARCTAQQTSSVI